MLWEITCYNGTVWEPVGHCDLTEALKQFKKETGLSEMDIKVVVNKH